ncbi:MAG: hypothetical protein E6R07_07275 [Nevskiaceae bacterium]|nr:MAG: hypothetical protein E6R07_07275 [Nevskiaceae bacterium]
MCQRADTHHRLAEGRVIAEGAPDEVLRNEMVRKVYLGEQFKL